MPTTVENVREALTDQPRWRSFRAGRAVGRAESSAERAAEAAEVAAEAAQSAAGLVERMSGWVSALAGRAGQPVPVQPVAAPGAEVVREPERIKGGVPGALKRTALKVSQRVSELSDGRFGLKAKAPKVETRPEKKALRRLERQARKEAKEAQPGAGVRWLPWTIGLSLGLALGLIGVAYWQRRRLQQLWGQASHRMQQAAEEARQRFEASRARAPQPAESGMPPGTPGFTALGPTPSASDVEQQGNGRMETTSP
jgi:hypothetical protein